MENGSWGVLSGKQMKEIIGTMKNMTVLEQMVTVKSSLKESQMEELECHGRCHCKLHEIAVPNQGQL